MTMELCYVTKTSPLEYMKLTLRQLQMMREAYITVAKRAADAREN